MKKKIAEKLLKKIYSKRYLILTIIVSIAILMSFFGFFKMIMILGVLALLNIGLSVITRGLPYLSTSIELIMFSTVLSGLVYGSKTGAIVGILFSILYYLGAGRMSIYVTAFAPIYAAIGFSVFFFGNVPVLYLGMICTIIYTMITSVIIVLLYSGRIDKALIFSVVNLLFNFIMFKYAAPILLILMR
jgi:hypothetical protein